MLSSHPDKRTSCYGGFRSVASLLVSVAAVALTPHSLAQDTNAPEITVTGQPVASPTPHDDWKAKLNHIMSEVSGTEITVTKKATVIKLEQQPTVVNNNQQELFTRAPGLLISEQHTPGQFNFSYRGLGNPQESEYVLGLQDGIPISTDWIGFPTIYYVPLPQSVSEIQLIRGGSSLLYGPEPAPAVNFVMKRPEPGSPFSAVTENIGGPDGFFSTYNAAQYAAGHVEFRADAGYVRTDGQRQHSAYDLWQSNVYLGYRPDDKQLWALDVHVSRFNGDDPGRLTYAQYQQDEDQSTTPFNHNWVDRYNVVLRHEHDFGGGWLLQAKAWYTHQEIDARAGLLQDEDFDNGGFDIRVRKNWGEGSIFKGSALTFGGVVYHGESPFRQAFAGNDTPRDDSSIAPRLIQDRSTDYQAIFAENIFRFGKFHIVPSFRLDHETVDVDTQFSLGPTPLGKTSADHWVPLWGIGLGNDFGHLNETYFSASSGWRPTRFFDIASPFQNLAADQNRPDPFHSIDIELGVHGMPIKGLWYDLGLFWMEFSNRTETQALSPTEFILANSGTSRHRGFEGELAYDFLAGDEAVARETTDAKDVKQAFQQTPSRFQGMHLVVFSNLQLLDAEFTESNTGLVGKEPAFAPSVLWKGGVTFRKEKSFSVSLTGVYVSEQFWADGNFATPTTPAKVPSYKVFNLSGDWYVHKNVRLIAGISNLADEKYYSRVFFNGSIEPAPRRTGYAGVALEF